MRRYLFILILAVGSLAAKKITIADIIDYYEKGEYKKACLYGIKIFNSFKNNEDLVAMYAISCMKSDYIDRLAVPAVILKNSPQARANAAYFATIVAQKKLLFHALFDNVDLSDLNFPKTDHIISKVFELYCRKKYKKFDDNLYIFKDPKEPDVSYEVKLIRDEKPVKIIVLKLKKGKIVQTHKYW